MSLKGLMIGAAGFILLLDISGAAYGQAVNPPGTVDMTVPMLTFGGDIMKDGDKRTADDKDCSNCPAMTRGKMIAAALSYNFCPAEAIAARITLPGCTSDEQGLKEYERWGRYELAKKLVHNKSAVLSNDQVSLIKRLVAARFPDGNMIAQIFTAIDPTAVPVEIK